MKKPSAFCFCMLACCSTVLAELNGTDDFNDNAMNTNKWTVFEGRLSETNNRLEFVSTGTEAEAGIWLWTLNYASYEQDWVVRIDAHNSISPAGPGEYGEVCLMVINSTDYDDSFDIDLEIEDSTPYIIESGWETNNVDGIWTDVSIGNTTDVSFQIAFDSTTKTLISSYDAGSGYTTLNRVNVSDWNIDPDHGFTPVIICESEGIVVSSGQVYADNFEAVTLPGISNHLDNIILSHLHDFGNPNMSADDVYEFDFTADTDASITNIILYSPSNATLVAVSDGVEEGMQTWRISSSASSPPTNDFGNGDYTVTVIYTNAVQQSTIVPFPALAAVTMQPLFTAPAPLHGALFSSTGAPSTNAWITLAWENIDPNANILDFHRHHVGFDDWESLGLFSDVLLNAAGPLATRSIGPLAFAPGQWGIENWFYNASFVDNIDGVFCVTMNAALSEYQFVVLAAIEDEDGDRLLNWWESLYFGGPTNAIASLDTDDDGQNNLEEYIAGTCPTNPESCLMITSCAPVGSGFMFEWHPSMTGRVYRTLWTDSLTNIYQELESDIPYPRNSFTDTVHGATVGGFYRVEVEMH